MAFLPYPPSGVEDAIAVFKQDVEIAHDVIHGSDITQVETENGLVPSFAKVIKELQEGVVSNIYFNLTPVSPSIPAVNSIFVDSTTTKLSFKDSVGVIHPLY